MTVLELLQSLNLLDETERIEAKRASESGKSLLETVCSYRSYSPVQIIRYANRLEIHNPGFSLKSPELLGEPGSEPRNPRSAASAPASAPGSAARPARPSAHRAAGRGLRPGGRRG